MTLSYNHTKFNALSGILKNNHFCVDKGGLAVVAIVDSKQSAAIVNGVLTVALTITGNGIILRKAIAQC